MGQAMTARVLAVLTIVALTAATRARAQDTPGPPPLKLPTGVRVRVSSNAFRGTVQGVLLRGDATSIHIAPESVGAVQSVPLASITKLEAALERRRNPLLGAVVGTVAFGLLGASFPVDPATCHDPSSTDFCSRTEAVGAGAFVGAALGAVAGLFIKSDRFVVVDVGNSRRTSDPAARRPPFPLSLAVTLRF
jgi:hypothetical protein